jgi:hypothetical protein
VHQKLLINALQKVNAESCTCQCQWQESDIVDRSHLAAVKQSVSGGSFNLVLERASNVLCSSMFTFVGSMLVQGESEALSMREPRLRMCERTSKLMPPLLP